MVKVSLYLREAGADLLWPLIQSFCNVASLTFLLSGHSQPNGRDSHQIWEQPDGQPLERHLNAALGACQGAHDPPGSGLTELRNMILCLHVSGPGTIEIGPMIINRTQTTLLGCVMTAAETARIHGDGNTSPEARDTSLRQLGQERVVELTAWADPLSS